MQLVDILGGDDAPDGTDPRRIIRGGGGDESAPECVIDNMAYHISLRSLEFARGDRQIPEYQRLSDAYTALLGLYDSPLLGVLELAEAHARLLEARLCRFMRADSMQVSRGAQATIPTRLYSAALVRFALFDPDVLRLLVNSTISYCEAIREIIGAARSGKWTALEPFGVLDGGARLDLSPAFPRDTPEEALEAELTVARYIQRIELYHCYVVRSLSDYFAGLSCFRGSIGVGA